MLTKIVAQLRSLCAVQINKLVETSIASSICGKLSRPIKLKINVKIKPFDTSIERQTVVWWKNRRNHGNKNHMNGTCNLSVHERNFNLFWRPKCDPTNCTTAHFAFQSQMIRKCKTYLKSKHVRTELENIGNYLCYIENWNETILRANIKISHTVNLAVCILSSISKLRN